MALVALAALFVLSEALYLSAGMGAKTCIDSLTGCRAITEWLWDIFFMYVENDRGIQVFVVKTSFGLPGFNNIFYLILGDVLTDEPGKFLATVAASILVGFLALWGYLATSAHRGAMMKLLLAVIFAIGWFALYNNAEASVYGVDVFATAMRRASEIPIAAISLLAVSLLTQRSS